MKGTPLTHSQTLEETLDLASQCLLDLAESVQSNPLIPEAFQNAADRWYDVFRSASDRLRAVAQCDPGGDPAGVRYRERDCADALLLLSLAGEGLTATAALSDLRLSREAGSEYASHLDSLSQLLLGEEEEHDG